MNIFEIGKRYSFHKNPTYVSSGDYRVLYKKEHTVLISGGCFSRVATWTSTKIFSHGHLYDIPTTLLLK